MHVMHLRCMTKIKTVKNNDLISMKSGGVMVAKKIYTLPN